MSDSITSINANIIGPEGGRRAAAAGRFAPGSLKKRTPQGEVDGGEREIPLRIYYEVPFYTTRSAVVFPLPMLRCESGFIFSFSPRGLFDFNDRKELAWLPRG